jgi:putative membrane protein insertion efficiency factor
VSGQPRPSLAARGLQLAIHGYRRFLGPLLGGQCRFSPTCSRYGLDALERHGAIRGSWLTACRIARCHPWGGSGHDPVP